MSETNITWTMVMLRTDNVPAFLLEICMMGYFNSLGRVLGWNNGFVWIAVVFNPTWMDTRVL
jgi:hypothetical protein